MGDAVLVLLGYPPNPSNKPAFSALIALFMVFPGANIYCVTIDRCIVLHV